MRGVAATYTHNGVTDTIRGWARRTGIPRATLQGRLNTFHWPVARALETPAKSGNRNLIRGPKHWYDYD